MTDEEKAQVPKITKALVFRALSYLKPYKPQMAAIMLLIVISSVTGLLPTMITGQIIDNGFPSAKNPNGNFNLLMLLLGVSFGLFIISGMLGVLQNYLNSWMSQHIVFDMRNQMFRHLEHMAYRFFTNERQGDLITRMTSDVDGVQQVVSGTLLNMFSNVVTLAAALTALFSTNWQLAVLGLFIVPFMIIPTRIVGRKQFDIMRRTQEKQDEMNQILNETLNVSGALLLKLFTREEKEYNKYAAKNKEAVNLSIRQRIVGQWFMMSMQILQQIGPTVIYFVAAIMLFRFGHAEITYGSLAVMVALIQRLYQPISSFFNMQVDFARSLALFNRLFTYFDMPQEIRDKPGAKDPGIVTGDIEFRNVSFHYSEESPILKDVSFHIKHGATTAIVGPSGAGKSTVINLIPRLYDAAEGAVLIDGTDVRDLEILGLRRNIGYVTQDTYMFNGTIKDNLIYARDSATDEEIADACKKANIHDFIMGLPEQYGTLVGNRGLKLSGGEKQRLSIARVILKDPKILLLDEATSSLDSISESMIQDAIEPLLSNRTGVVIAHRLSTIMEADEIIVLQDGIVRGRGSHRELLASNEVYRELYNTQFSKAIEDYKSAYAVQGM